MAFVVAIALANVADAVFDHDHGAVHDHAEIDGAQAQQAGGDAEAQHAGKSEQHRQWNGQGHNGRRAQISQKEKQDRNHQQARFKQVLAHRFHDVIDQLGPIINRCHFHIGRQSLLDIRQLVFQGPGHLMTVLAHEHEAQAQNDFALAVGGHRAPADFMANLHVGDIQDADGHALLGGDDNVFDLLHVHGAAHAVDQQHFLPPPDAAAADIPVVFLDGLEHFRKSQPVPDELVRIDAALVLLFITTPTVDLRRPLDRA